MDMPAKPTNIVDVAYNFLAINDHLIEDIDWERFQKKKAVLLSMAMVIALATSSASALEENAGEPRHALDSPASTLALTDLAGYRGEVTARDREGRCLAFMADAERDGWIATDFDWRAFLETPEARRQLRETEAIGSLDVKGLRRLVTAIVRETAFEADSLSRAFDDGTIAAIAERADALRR